jgi:hypothetical protein
MADPCSGITGGIEGIFCIAGDTMKFKAIRRILAIFFPQYRFRLIEQVGGEVARECRAGVWQSVRRQVCCMSAPEARGYVRAQAAWFAAVRVGPSLDHYSLKPSLRAQVLESGVQQLISMIIHDSLVEAAAVEPKTLAA